MSNHDNLATPPHSSDDIDLDDLLDSALDDFNTLNLNNKSKSKEAVVGVQGLGLGLGLGLPELSKKKPKPKANKPHVSEALDKLRAHTQEAVKGLGSSSLDEPAIEDWVNQFQELAGSHDMESIMETMMQQLLSKEILQKPMREIGEKYPQWLEDHRGSVSPEEYERFSKQNELIVSLSRVYEEEPNNFDKIVDLMQKMQECGQPPSDILDQIAPDFASQLPPDMLDPQTNCSIM